MLQIPRYGDAAHIIQAGLRAADIRAMMLAAAGDGIVSGLSVAQDGAGTMNVVVASGVSRIAGYYAYSNGGTIAIAASHATLYRIDLVVMDWNGVISVVAGTAADDPIQGQIPSNSISLAQVVVPPAATSILTAEIYDKGPTVWDSYELGGDCLNSATSATPATSAGSITEANLTASATGTPVFAFQNSDANHPGILRVQTGTTSANNTRIHLGAAANTAVLSPTLITRMRCVFRIPDITTMAFKFGAGQDMSVATADQLGTAGMFWEFVPATNAKLRCGTRQGAASTMNVDTGANVANNAWFDLIVNRLQNGNVQFIKNGALAFTNTANLPTTVLNAGLAVHTLTAALRSVDVDFIGFNFVPPSANRWT